jgi:hypothetical protein
MIPFNKFIEIDNVSMKSHHSYIMNLVWYIYIIIYIQLAFLLRHKEENRFMDGMH